jgi:hypothetical protein
MATSGNPAGMPRLNPGIHLPRPTASYNHSTPTNWQVVIKIVDLLGADNWGNYLYGSPLSPMSVLALAGGPAGISLQNSLE